MTIYGQVGLIIAGCAHDVRVYLLRTCEENKRQGQLVLVTPTGPALPWG